MPGKVIGTIQDKVVTERAAMLVPLLITMLLAGAVIFYKERMLFIDAPHVFFRVINDGAFHIEEHRYGSFITQLFPLAGSKLHLPFRLLVVLYSACFYLFYLFVSLMVLFRYRNNTLAILFGLYLTLFVSDTFYWPNNEVHQGMAWLMLAFAVILHMGTMKRSTLYIVPVFFILFSLAIWTHPLIMIIAVFLWLFFWMGNISWPFTRRQSLLYSGILLLICFLKFFQGRQHGYDGTKLEMVTGFELSHLRSLVGSPQFRFFVVSCHRDYWLFTLVFFAGLVSLVWQKRFVLFMLTILFAAVYILLVCIAFKDPAAYRFYIESEYMPLSVICCAPFVCYALPRLRMGYAVLVVALIFSVRLVYIYNASPIFTARVALLDNMLNRMDAKSISKVIIAGPARVADSTLIMNWGAPAESMILSRLKGQSPQRTFIFLDAGQLPGAQNTGADTLLGCWEKRSVNAIDRYYFRFDTTTTYRVMSYKDLLD